MKATTKRRIEAAIEEVAGATEENEYAIAAHVLAIQTPDVLLTLATAALVDAARRKRRGVALMVERKAEGRRQPTPDAAYAAENERFDREHADALSRTLRSIVEEYANKLRVEWTAELLASEFAMPDGTRTTWGAASIAQHRERVAMFAANAQANLEGAARHEKAIAELESARADNLLALMAVAA